MEDVFQLGIKALIRNSEGKILLLQVNPEKFVDHDGTIYWDIPGGRVQRGKTVEQTLKSEIEEETGINDISRIEKIDTVLSNIRIPIKDESMDVGLILSIFSCTIPENSEIKLSAEHTKYGWFSPTDASEKLKYKYPKEFTDKILELE